MACTSPGSRCAPLVLTLAREQRLQLPLARRRALRGVLRAGAAKASGLPVAVTCTSGTAAAELLPAAIEAREARVPLLLLTRRPPAGAARERRGSGDRPAEAVRGRREVVLRGRHARRDPARLRWIRTLACRAYWTALEGRPGVVHLNFPLREPLVPTSRCRPMRPAAPERPTICAPRADAGRGRRDAALARAGRRSPARRLVAGRHERRRRDSCSWAQAAPRRSARRAGWPLLADPLSGARRGAAAVAHYDALLRDEAFAAVPSPRPRPAGRRSAGVKAAARLARGPGQCAPGGARPRGRVAGPGVGARRLARAGARRGARGSWPQRPPVPASRTGSPAGAPPTSARRRRSSACSRGGPRRACGRRRARRAAAARGDAVRRLLDAGARHRDVLARARGSAARAVQPRRQRHRRDRLERVRRGRRGRGPGRAADRRRGARARHRRPARRRAPGIEADDRAVRQRRRRDLRLPARLAGGDGARPSGRRGRTSTPATSPPPRAWTSPGRRRCTAWRTSASGRSPPSRRPGACARAAERLGDRALRATARPTWSCTPACGAPSRGRWSPGAQTLVCERVAASTSLPLGVRFQALASPRVWPSPVLMIRPRCSKRARSFRSGPGPGRRRRPRCDGSRRRAPALSRRGRAGCGR